jgi:hypothetical protein
VAITRTIKFAGALGAAVVGGALLFVTAPPSSLVDAPMFKADAGAGDFSTPITPPLADFYKVTNWQAGPPGKLVKAEVVPGAPAGTKVYRIMYQSTDLKGNALPVTALFAYPDTPPPPGGFPLVSFGHGTTGVGQACGISHTPFEPETPSYSAWLPHIKPLVDAGNAVVASDYSGMGAPGPSSYVVGPLESRGMLDALRAVKDPSPSTGSVAIDPKGMQIYGKSQGGESALSTVQNAEEYAPELDIIGGVVLAPGYTPPIPGVLDAVASSPTSTDQNMFILLIAKSYAANYPELVHLDDILTPLGQERIGLLDKYCGSDLGSRVSDVPLNSLVKTPFTPGLITALAAGMPGTTPHAFKTPIVVVQGLEDVTILPEATHAQVMQQCALGNTVYYVRYPHDDHGAINFQARLHDPSVIDWMKDRRAGNEAPNNCANQLLGTMSSATGVK